MSWKGIKQTINIEDTQAWCNDMDIKDYTINSKGEIDVNGYVWLNDKDFKELPYKFGKVNGTFSLFRCKNLKSLKNCPDYVGNYFDVDNCIALESLEGCPKEVNDGFYCKNCKRKFTKKEVKSLCRVKGDIIN